MITATDRIVVRDAIAKLPTMTSEEISALKLRCDQDILLIRGQIEAAGTDATGEKADWLRRTKSCLGKLGYLSQAIQEQRSLRKKSLTEHPDVKFLACLQRAMKAILSPELCDKIIATAVEIQKGGDA